jgi:DNA-binding NarL/FixJ family response regulator
MHDQQSQTPIRVVLADDHAVVRAGIRQFLERSGHIQVVAEAGDGLEACEQIAKKKPDVAIFDLQMPVRSGIDATHWVRENYPAIGVLVLTAYDDEPFVKAALKAGAVGYVLKTAEPDEIVEAVEDVFQGKAVLDVALAQRLIVNIAQPTGSKIEDLTERELEILTLTGRGLTNKAIGLSLNISDRTVQNHLAHIFQKLQAASRTEAVMRAVALGLLPTDLTTPSPGM